MGLLEFKTKDLMRGRDKEIVIRFDPRALAELSCEGNYDPVMSGPVGKEGKRAFVIRKIEIKKRDGAWSPYPSVVWLDGVEYEDQLQTKAIVKTGDGIHVMASADGVPDGKLMASAAAAGIHTETIG